MDTDMDAPSAHSVDLFVFQASGMVSTQVNCTLSEAFGLLCGRARAKQTGVDAVSADVVQRRIRFVNYSR